MKIIEFPTSESVAELIKRPVIETRSLEKTVAEIVDNVRRDGDASLKRYAKEFDGVEIDRLDVSDGEFAYAESQVDPELKNALSVAKANIEKFHDNAEAVENVIETTPGVFCWRKQVPIEKVGLYIPAGSAPLFSTVLMLAVPAKLAGCSEILLCSPPGQNGRINAATLYAAKVCGVTRVFKAGGAQAIAALAFGTTSIPKVDKIFGPGNQYVTEAKQLAARAGVAIDMPAGPSELAVLADETAVPSFVASDLLSQAEHGPDSQVILVSTSRSVIKASIAEVKRQLAGLPRRRFAEASLAHSKAVLVDSLDTGIEIINRYAPEHLIIATADPESAAESIVNAGSVFLGNYSCESAGDYASGTNHTLPTNGFARSFSGISVESFTKKITFQRLTEDGLRQLGPVITTMARAEGLAAHERAVSIRLTKTGGGADV